MHIYRYLYRVRHNMYYKISLKKMPPSINHAYFFKRMGKRTIKIKTNVAKQYFEYVKSEVRRQVKNVKVITGSVKVKIDIGMGDKRRRDIDNIQKILLDSLTGIFWLDDSQIVDLHTKKYMYKPKHFKIIIEISDANEL